VESIAPEGIRQKSPVHSLLEGLQPEVVERRRPQADGESVHLPPEDAHHPLASARRGGRGLAGRLDRLEREGEPGQELADRIVKVAGDPPLLVLLGRRQRIQRPLQLRAPLDHADLQPIPGVPQLVLHPLAVRRVAGHTHEPAAVPERGHEVRRKSDGNRPEFARFGGTGDTIPNVRVPDRPR